MGAWTQAQRLKRLLRFRGGSDRGTSVSDTDTSVSDTGTSSVSCAHLWHHSSRLSGEPGPAKAAGCSGQGDKGLSPKRCVRGSKSVTAICLRETLDLGLLDALIRLCDFYLRCRPMSKLIL